MKTSRVKVQYAKTHLSALIASVQRGEEVVIARGDTPAARLVAVEPPAERELGFVAYAIPESFSDPLPEGELSAWEVGA
ncbi:antitoxin (DNA-binding transcriptional repressor) of toxin-antitoxin stability system [Microbacterium testaceum]|uniref:type II toxin-antitoxin system Phd/YefM family antitoxin n=1 Tax=Microbacterium testaceum TaxID=2033 RepID=UPI00278B95C9|nr:type II toxin-antitoxin system Phd/YefM family antitoxin [Microbacterium testaceum]MDQ1173278.1 antitoxin (DNA-binding transcriptional repressor) of toxin-antitoxin stability system [Microbacterium testaceum]